MDPVFHPAMAAIVSGDLTLLRQLLTEDPELATRGSSCSHPTLLCHVAVDGGLGKLADPSGAARVLIEVGSALEAPLVSAASTGARGVIDVLLEAGAPIDACAPWTPAEEANYWGRRAIVDHLLIQGAEIRSLRLASGCGDLERTRAFLANGKLSPQAGPVRCPFADAIDVELAHEPQEIIDQALSIAVLNRQRGTSQELLDRGARVNSIPSGTHWRATVLHAVVERGLADMIPWLLDAGADPTIPDPRHGGDAIGWARHFKRDDLVALLESG